MEQEVTVSTWMALVWKQVNTACHTLKVCVGRFQLIPDELSSKSSNLQRLGPR